MAGRQHIDDKAYESTELKKEYLINKSGMEALGVEFDPNSDLEDTYLLDQDPELEYDDFSLDEYKDEFDDMEWLDESNY